MAVDNTNYKGCWRPEEDEALRKAVAIHGEKNWSVVARHFNTLMGRSAVVGRAPKQCRSRYLQQLVPGIKTGEWTAEEEEVLVDGHRQFGNQWTLIASMLPGRTETSVKNHYNCTARRKVPTDLSRMTILQRYLASIGVITLTSTGKSSGKFPSLGSGYPSSSSSQFFQTHAATRGSNRAAAAARSAPISPGGSHQYDEFEEERQLAVAEHHEQQHLMLSQQHGEEEEEHHQQYEQYEQHGYDDQCMAEAGGTEGAAVGLLQLARAALMHMEEEEEEEGAGSHQHKQDPGDDLDTEEDAAAGQQLFQQQAQLKQLRHGHSRPTRTASGSWIKPELMPVVRSNSEDSDHTAEEEEEGSPMAEANLRLQLQQQLRPAGSGLTGKRSPSGRGQLAGIAGSKRHRPIWEHPAAAAPAGAAASPAAAASSHSRLRPVLDVSEPQFTAAAMATAGGGDDTPTSPPPMRSSSPATLLSGQPDTHAQLLALMMQAFMGAAAEGSPSATSLSPNHLAAVARVMALSGLALGGQGLPGAAGAAGGAGGAAGASNAVADMLAALMQEGAAGGVPGAPAAAVWPSSLEQHMRAAAGQ